MVWTAPMTAVAGAFTAANFNLHIRDNLLANSPGVASVIGSYFVSTAANTLAERRIGRSYQAATVATASVPYVSLGTGPAATVTTGTRAIVGVGCLSDNTVGNARGWMSFAVSGATVTAASDAWAAMHAANNAGSDQGVSMWTMATLTAGSNTFTPMYRVSSGTSSFQFRHIIVIPL